MDSSVHRIGIDFGGTIGQIEDDVPAPHAYEMIQHLVCKFGAANLFVISKAKQAMERQIRAWLKQTDFLQTGFLPENILFVREYIGKAQVVQDLGITIFFDDHAKVVRSLVTLEQMERVFWMHADPSKIAEIPKTLRHKIAFTQSWSSTMKYFQRIPKNNTESEEDRAVVVAFDSKR